MSYLVTELDEHLTDHFTLWECIRSDYAERHNIDNTPPEEFVGRARVLCERVFEPVRNHYGVPYRPNSVYRCPGLNKEIGGSKNSKHMSMEAGDIEVPGISNYNLAIWCRDNLSEYDTIILECYTKGIANSGWVHISRLFEGINRRLTFTYYKNGDKVEGLWA